MVKISYNRLLVASSQANMWID